MRRFFVLTFDECGVPGASRANWGAFDYLSLWSGQPVAPDALRNARLHFDASHSVDLVPNTFAITIVSSRLLECVRHLLQATDRCLPAPIFDLKSETHVEGYHIIHSTCLLDALARPLSSVSDITLNAAQIPDHAHIFRLERHKTVTLISDEVLSCITGRGFKGIALLPTKTA
jgi:hypothetical protein